MVQDGTSGDGAAPPRGPVEGAVEARERSRELRVQLGATRARLAQLRRVGSAGGGQPDGFEELRDQLGQAREQIGHLETALATNRRIGMAIGIVMVRRNVTDEQAFALLCEQSQLRNEKLRDLAEEVIYTGTL